jgi:ABC-type lipoprotein release transport system permease subunit
MNWLEKQKNIVDIALSSLVRRWKKNLALAIIYTLIVFIMASVVFFTHALKREAHIILRDSPEIVVQRIMAGRHELIPGRYMDVIGKIKGVTAVRGRLWGYYYEPSVGANYTLLVTDESRTETESIAIGQGVARTIQAGMGDLIPFKSYDGSYLSLEVRRIFPAESELLSSDLVEIGEADFRRLFGMPAGLYTDLTLQVRNPNEVATVADKIRRLLPDTRPILRDEIMQTYDAIFDWRGGLVLMIAAGAVLAFIIFAWDKATSLSAEERREIGILKALGWDTSDVLMIKSWEGIIISLSAFFTGIILAYGHVFFSSFFLFEPILKGWSVLFPRFQPVPFIDPYQVGILFFLTVVPYTTATVIPTWTSATIDPDEIMRL